jgi:ferredoxin-thioredoxin reductase catalytic subunit
MEKKLYELYIAPENMNNVKHRARLAPDRMFTRKAMLKLKNRADKYGLSMTLCHWVRSELDITPAEVPVTLRKNRIENKLIKIGVCKPV